jgi:hypothetical protein
MEDSSELREYRKLKKIQFKIEKWENKVIFPE